MASGTKYTILRDSTAQGSDLDESKEQIEPYSTFPRRRTNLALWVTYLLIAVLSASISSLVTQNISLLWPDNFLLAPSGNIRTTWAYNRTFSDSPTPETEEAWRSIFPRGRGFFAHPRLEANISGIAVFHELHCLHGIRLAYYAALNQTAHGDESALSESKNPDAKVDSANAHNDPHHVRHCFDYLRRALMCAADTNIEKIDWHVGGSTGWGFERQCRDYDAVVSWAEQWRYHSQTEIE